MVNVNMKLAYPLLLPVIGFGLWLTTHWITEWALNHAYVSNDQLQTDLYPEIEVVRSLTIISIYARVDRGNDITEVTLATTQNMGLQQLEFKFPLTDPAHLETALATELGITETSIRSLMSYRFD